MGPRIDSVRGIERPSTADRPQHARPARTRATVLAERVRTRALLGGSAVALAYVPWRLTATDLTAPLQVTFLAVELWAVAHHVLLAATTFRTPRPPITSGGDPGGRVAVLIPTIDEEPGVLLPVIACAVRMDRPHETVVLDDGRRRWVREAAAELGATYLTRPDNGDAKAGNLNHALDRVDADFVAVLDADHVPERSFLRRLLPYLVDPDVALVQAPHDYYNTETAFDRGPSAATDAGFHRGIQPARDRCNAAFWCGSSAILRVEALRRVGGVSTETVTEDLQTTVSLHAAGWHTVVHDEPLTRGLAPTRVDDYLCQRERWATGAMQLLRSGNSPLRVSGLTWSQRLAYLEVAIAWFAGLRLAAYQLVSAVSVLTGLQVVTADPIVFLGAHVLVQVLLFGMAWTASGGHRGVFETPSLDVLGIPIGLRALRQLVGGRRQPFDVTPKGAVGGAAGVVPASLRFLVAFGASAWCWFVAVGLGVLPGELDPYLTLAATMLLIGLVHDVSAIARVHARRHRGEQRHAWRAPDAVAASVDGTRCRLDGMSLRGARADRRVSPGPVAVTLILPNGDLGVDAFAEDDGRGGSLLHLSTAGWRPLGNLAAALFLGDLDPVDGGPAAPDPAGELATDPWTVAERDPPVIVPAGPPQESQTPRVRPRVAPRLAAVASLGVLGLVGGVTAGMGSSGTSSAPAVAWRLDTGGGITSTAVVTEVGAERRIVVGRNGHHAGLIALDDSGREVWAAETGAGVFGSPALVSLGPADDVVVAASSDGVVHAVDVVTGEARWTSPVDGCSPVPCGLHGDLVVPDDLVVALPGGTRSPVAIVADESGTVHALAVVTGEILWQAQVADGPVNNRVAWVPGPAPRLVVAGTDGTVRSLDPRDGAEVATVEVGPVWYVDPAVHATGADGAPEIWVGGEQRSGDGVLWRLSADLEVVDTVAVPSDALVTTRPHLSSDGTLVVIGTASGAVVAVEVDTGLRRWVTQVADEPVKGSPAARGDVLHVGTSSRTLVALDERTGHVRWRHRAGAILGASEPVIEGGRLYVGSEIADSGREPASPSMMIALDLP